jgi:hypothetical protein
MSKYMHSPTKAHSSISRCYSRAAEKQLIRSIGHGLSNPLRPAIPDARNQSTDTAELSTLLSVLAAADRVNPYPSSQQQGTAIEPGGIAGFCFREPRAASFSLCKVSQKLHLTTDKTNSEITQINRNLTSGRSGSAYRP